MRAGRPTRKVYDLIVGDTILVDLPRTPGGQITAARNLRDSSAVEVTEVTLHRGVVPGKPWRLVVTKFGHTYYGYFSGFVTHIVQKLAPR